MHYAVSTCIQINQVTKKEMLWTQWAKTKTKTYMFYRWTEDRQL